MKYESCLECGSEIGKYGKKFCSRRCSGLYNNRNCEKLKKCKKGPAPKLKGPASKLIRFGNCTWCKKSLKKSARKFCSRQCQANYYRDKMIKAWLAGEYNGTSRRGLSVAIRDQLLIENNYSCIKCGWNKINKHTNRSPLEIHHMDGNAYNNRPENLEVLCPSCHSLSKHHHGANKGNGRREYLKKYYIRESNGKII